MKSGKVHIKNANYFAEYPDLAIDNIISQYHLVIEALERPDDIDSVPKITSNSRDSPSQKRIQW